MRVVFLEAITCNEALRDKSGATNVYHLVTINGCHKRRRIRRVVSPPFPSLTRYVSHEKVKDARNVGEMLGRLAVDVWLLLKLKISIPIRTPGFIEAQFVSLLQDNTHSSRGQ